MRKIAISDIHGCYLSFKALLDKIAFTLSDKLYLLGDYIDRGPDSKKVVDYILDLKKKGYKVHCLAGNHDFALVDAKTDPSFFPQWYNGWGGKQTMDSFETNDPNKIPGRYWDFVMSLEMTLEVDNYIFVHAGLDFMSKNPLKSDINMLFIRNWYQQIDYSWLGDRYIIHGHTPVSCSQIEIMMRGFNKARYLDIDAGCFAKHMPGKGFLCAFDLTNRELYFQKNLDDVSAYWGHY